MAQGLDIEVLEARRQRVTLLRVERGELGPDEDSRTGAAP